MLNTYVVEGGIGKCVAFTALIPKLAEKAKQQIQIYTPYVDCFAFNPNVKMAYEQSIPLIDARLQASDNIFYCEPYKSNFAFGKQHIIESFCELLSVDYDSSMAPKIYTTHLKDACVDWLEKKGITGKYMLVQFSGGQTPFAAPGIQYQSSNPTRNYPPYLAQQVIARLKAKFPHVAIIDCTMANEPGYAGTVKYEGHWAGIHELLKRAEGFIAIDSCMNHFSASAQKAGVILWGSTRWSQFGYSHNTNLQFHMKDKWDESRFEPNDPRNIMVDPEEIIEAYTAKVNTGKLIEMNVHCLSA